jgi:copper chaperone CopZ
MKFLRILVLFLVAGFTLTACNTPSKKKPEAQEIVAPNPQKLAFNISGMTCEIGCAKTIQSKLSKKPGITSAKIIFNDSIAFVEYNANAISQEDITSFVNGIAGGSLYTVKNAKSVTTFNETTK